MSNYHGCKGKATNLIPHYLIDIIYNTVKSSQLQKLQMIQNINNLMFQVIFMFSDWILIKQIIVFSTPFCLGETDFQKILPRVLSGGTVAWVKIHIFSAFSRNVNSINSTHSGIYKLQKIQQALWREIKP